MAGGSIMTFNRWRTLGIALLCAVTLAVVLAFGVNRLSKSRCFQLTGEFNEILTSLCLVLDRGRELLSFLPGEVFLPQELPRHLFQPGAVVRVWQYFYKRTHAMVTETA